jgi:hypothetical protein
MSSREPSMPWSERSFGLADGSRVPLRRARVLALARSIRRPRARSPGFRGCRAGTPLDLGVPFGQAEGVRGLSARTAASAPAQRRGAEWGSTRSLREGGHGLRVVADRRRSRPRRPRRRSAAGSSGRRRGAPSLQHVAKRGRRRSTRSRLDRTSSASDQSRGLAEMRRPSSLRPAAPTVHLRRCRAVARVRGTARRGSIEPARAWAVPDLRLLGLCRVAGAPGRTVRCFMQLAGARSREDGGDRDAPRARRRAHQSAGPSS